ncbi:MAG TPA: hypothetical protein VMH23_00595 [Bacteroidota bacterium]|nr:hypothetical protein [Bacteroidota bacterium]
MKTPHAIQFIAVVILITAGLLAVHVPLLHPAWMYTLVFVGTSAFFGWMSWLLLRTELSERFLFAILVVAFLVRLSFVASTPIGSDDIYRYMWDGKVQSSHINPYLYAPDSSALSSLHSDLLPCSVNHPTLKTLYFPFSEWIFYLGYQMSGEHVWGYKILLLASELATFLALFLLLRLMDIPRKYLLLYALCPLPILQFGLDGHLDAIGFPLLLFGLFSFLSRRRMIGLILFGLSISIKPVAVVLLPVLFFAERSWGRRFLVLGVPAIVVAIQFLPYVISSNPFEALGTFARDWTFNGIVFEGVYAVLADNQKSRLICLGLLCVLLLIVYLSNKNLPGKMNLAVLLLLLCSPVVHPWYIAWLTLLLPLTRSWTGIVYSMTASLTSVTILTYKLSGMWGQPWWALIAEYLPVIVVLTWEVSRAGQWHFIPGASGGAG